MGLVTVMEYLLTYLWVGMECFAAILLFDGFSERKRKQREYWITILLYTVLIATAVNFIMPGIANFGRMVFVIASYAFLHSFLYRTAGLFCLCISAIHYGTICCIDNLCVTLNNYISATTDIISINDPKVMSLIVHILMIAACYIQSRCHRMKAASVISWKWYTWPALLSFASVLLIFFFGACFRQKEISVLPLFVCASFITFMQFIALFLVSWMEQNAHFREETLSLHTKAQAQQESIEALSAAYAQQRKLTHDFRAHLDILASMLEQESPGICAARDYIRTLQVTQTKRMLLVNTRHSALDALLNQKALVARNRNIDIQFYVNDLSSVKICMVDLTILISNTLDNAIEACEKLPVEDRQIHVQLLLEDDELFFAVRNRSLPVDIVPGRLPISTKENPSLHGYGLQNVRTTIKKYNSFYAMSCVDGWFEFATDLPNTLIS